MQFYACRRAFRKGFRPGNFRYVVYPPPFGVSSTGGPTIVHSLVLILPRARVGLWTVA